MSSRTFPPVVHPTHQPFAVPVASIADDSLAPVYAVRSPEDLESVRGLTTPRSLDPMGAYLVGKGVITTEDLKEALSIQRNSANRRLGWILCKLGHLDDLALGRLLAAHLGVPCVTLAYYRPRGDYRQRLPEPILQDGSVAVLHEEELHAWVAVPDVTNQQALKDAGAWLRKIVSPVMAAREEVARYLRGEDDTAARLGGKPEDAARHLEH